MAHPYLTYYLLKLATDCSEFDDYKAANCDQRMVLGEEAGLNTAQSDALASGDATSIMAEVYKELGLGTYAGGVHHTIQLQLDLDACKKNG